MRPASENEAAGAAGAALKPQAPVTKERRALGSLQQNDAQANRTTDARAVEHTTYSTPALTLDSLPCDPFLRVHRHHRAEAAAFLRAGGEQAALPAEELTAPLHQPRALRAATAAASGLSGFLMGTAAASGWSGAAAASSLGDALFPLEGGCLQLSAGEAAGAEEQERDALTRLASLLDPGGDAHSVALLDFTLGSFGASASR